MSYPSRNDEEPTTNGGIGRTIGIGVAGIVALVLLVVVLHLTGVVGPS